MVSILASSFVSTSRISRRKSGDIGLCRDAIAQGGVQSLGLGARLFIVETGGCQPVDIGQSVEGQSG